MQDYFDEIEAPDKKYILWRIPFIDCQSLYSEEISELVHEIAEINKLNCSTLFREYTDSLFGGKYEDRCLSFCKHE